jgi:hypothetical protein
MIWTPRSAGRCATPGQVAAMRSDRAMPRGHGRRTKTGRAGLVEFTVGPNAGSRAAMGRLGTLPAGTSDARAPAKAEPAYSHRP